MNGDCPVCGDEDFDIVFDAPSWSLDFDDIFIESILKGEKTSTLRLGERHKKEYSTGDLVALRDEDGEDFAWAKITGVTEMTAESVVASDFEGHGNYRTIEDLALAMRRYYPNDYIGPETEMTHITFWAFSKKQGHFEPV